MRNQYIEWRMVLLVGIVLSLISACAPPPLEVFLSPNPDFDESSTSQFTPQQQPAPSQPLIPGNIVQSVPVHPTVTYSPEPVVTIQTVPSPHADNRLVLQLNDTLREAEALLLSGEARLQEQNPVEAIREFERARLVLEQDYAPTLQHVEQQSLLQGNVGILSLSEIQRYRNQYDLLLTRINRSYDFQAMYQKQAAEEKFEALRRTNKVTTQPVATTSTPLSASRVLLQPRPRPPITPGASWLNISWIPEVELEQAINQFQTRSADFRSCLARANQYFPQVSSILLQEGVPEELAYVALIESGYQPSACSSSGDAGLWQLSKSVARSYGLNVSSTSDERLSVSKATRVFARYMRDLHRQYGGWELAILAYHLGGDALRGAMSYTGSSDLQMLMNYSSAARSYLAKLTASMIIARNPAAYGFDGTLASLPGQYAVQTGGQYAENKSVGMLEPPVLSLY